ncbi:MAG: lysophospholipid acyltransferase family protein [Williamsia sp.]|nr:lysophospholipid acyltransferase family protein [Williamsia sp.]
MYYFVYGFLYLISLLPLRLLFVISDGIYALVYYGIGYRKEVVMRNLDIAFPEKSQAEKSRIAKQFYRNFIDNFIETIKMLSASNAYLRRHLTGNWQMLDELYKKGKSCNVLLGHMFNWELANHVVSLETKHKFLVVYMPIASKLINRLFLKLRSKGKTHLLSAHNMRNDMLPYRNELYALVLVADQNPAFPNRAYWLNFFSQPAPFVKGPEKSARANELPVVFCHFEKTKRGYYRAVLHLETEHPTSMPEGELTMKYARYLEGVIRKDPAMWLWSHRRWKHKWQPQYAPSWIDDKPVIESKKVN